MIFDRTKQVVRPVKSILLGKIFGVHVDAVDKEMDPKVVDINLNLETRNEEEKRLKIDYNSILIVIISN
jgi:hypothetical protein